MMRSISPGKMVSVPTAVHSPSAKIGSLKEQSIGTKTGASPSAESRVTDITKKEDSYDTTPPSASVFSSASTTTTWNEDGSYTQRCSVSTNGLKKIEVGAAVFRHTSTATSTDLQKGKVKAKQEKFLQITGTPGPLRLKPFTHAAKSPSRGKNVSRGRLPLPSNSTPTAEACRSPPTSRPGLASKVSSIVCHEMHSSSTYACLLNEAQIVETVMQ